MLNYKTMVLEKHPNAQAKYHKAVFESGHITPIEHAKWSIYTNGGLGNPPLANGTSERQAWQNAWACVEKEEALKDTNLDDPSE